MTRNLPGLLAGLLAWGSLMASTPLLAETDIKLEGNHVANITRVFLRNHYSRPKFDDKASEKVLARFLRSYDSGHFYFLASDVKEFNAFAAKLDDQIPKGDMSLPFLVHQRFLSRMAARERLVKRLLQETIDLKTNDRRKLDRGEDPYPYDEGDVETLWRRRLKFELLELTLAGRTQQEAKETLNRRYRNAHWRVEKYSDNDVLSAFLNSFTRVYDPHSSYMSPDDLENFNISLRLSLDGIGATLRWEDGITIISSIIPGGAAFREGSLMPEDKIVAVAQGRQGEFEDVRNQRLIDVVKLIRGKRGSTVKLAFLRKQDGRVEKRIEVTIIRDKIVLKEGEAKSKIIERPALSGSMKVRIGVVELPSFYVDFSQRRSNPDNFKSASRDVAKILGSFNAQKVQGVVLDLRNNGGGGLDEAVTLAGLFLSPGPVVMVKDIRGRISILSNPHDEPLYSGPLMVLINRYSASASEIVAGALKDYGRAIVVGDVATFGKGTVQNIINLPSGIGALKTTVAKFYRPGSGSTQERGVRADIVLPSLNNHLDIGESSLDNRLPWDSVRRPAFSSWGDMDALIPVLSERSRQRRAKDSDFREVETAINTYLQTQKGKKEITLQEMVSAGKNGPSKKKVEPKKAEKPKADFVQIETAEILRDFIKITEGTAGGHVASGQG